MSSAQTTARTEASDAESVLSVRDLQTSYFTPAGIVRAVDGVSFDLTQGQTLGIVGESGSGKSVTSLSVMGLIDPPGRVTEGSIKFRGRELVGMKEAERRQLRGRDLCLVFQDPMSALNPVYRIGTQVVEAIQVHSDMSGRDAHALGVELLRQVGIPDPDRRMQDYPHNLSGGLRQRVTIAMAMANGPDLLILDEPTTALDVTIQAQILELIKGLKETTVMLITHDIGVVREMCDHVVVMYGGRVMEHGTVDQITRAPKHPYTRGLLASIPSARMRGKPLHAIPGSVPSPLAMPPGCPFAPRCASAMPRCARKPPLSTLEDGRRIACWLEVPDQSGAMQGTREHA